LAKTFKLAAKEVLGSCVSMGVTVDGKDPREVQKGIDEGLYDEMFSKSEA
jgi:large subunit ribosomal protein L11